MITRLEQGTAGPIYTYTPAPVPVLTTRSVVPYRCPVCEGRGTVPHGFYSTSQPCFSSTGTGREKCQSCGGSGVLWR